MKTFALLVATAALGAVLIAGCGGANHTTTTKLTAAQRPNPFRIVARYSASSLGLKNPHDLAIGPDGNVYITDASDRVIVVSPEGRVLRTWGKGGSRPGEFHFVGNPDVHAEIAVGPDGKVYVSDSGNYRVEVFTATGRFLRQFGSYGFGRGQFQAPLGIAVDAAGDVYVADDQAQTLSKFSPSGQFEWSIGGATSSDPNLVGFFHKPNVDPHNRVIAAVDGAQAVVYIDSDGHKVDSFSTVGYFPGGVSACSATVAPGGYVVLESCPGPTTGPVPAHPYRTTLLLDRAHRLVGAWYHSPFALVAPPRFGPHGEVFALAADGSILKLKVSLSGA
jgi:streptogramin lyase